MAASVLLAARNALGANRDTIEIVHFLGASDAQIARIFQRSMGIDAAGGGIVGLIFAVAAILFLGQQFAAMGAGMVAGGTFGWIDWLVLALVPIAAVLLAMITARLSVMHALRKML
jgi:cell division transport system permease protein